MLAAVSEVNSELEIIRRALQLVTSGSAPVPESIQQYFNKILSQANQLLTDPKSLDGKILPDSIDLALELRNVPLLLKEIKKIHNFQQITEKKAEKLLRLMEHDTVH